MSQNAYILGSIAKTKFLMLFKKTAVMYCGNHTKGRNAQNTLYIVPTDARYYTNHRILNNNFKIILTRAPTCFGSRRNHPQGVVLCLAKTT